MAAATPPVVTDDAQRPPGRVVVVGTVRALLTTTALAWLYFLAPLENQVHPSAIILFGISITVYAGLVTWQVRSVAHAQSPRLRAIEVLTISAPLLLLIFAITYFELARDSATAFSEPLSRLDALYFTITTFATVGFGDIVAQSETARAIVTIQMVVDLLVIAIGVRVLLGAVRMGLSRLPKPPPAAEPDSPVDEPLQEPTHHRA